MSLVEWDDSYSVNSEEMDKQHQKWIKILNDLDDYMCNPGKNVQTNIAHKTLKEMMTYATYHFEKEADYMRSMNYPDFIGHIRLHKDFDSQIYDKYREVMNGEVVLSSELINMVRDWLINHILVEDKKYAVFAEKADKN